MAWQSMRQDGCSVFPSRIISKLQGSGVGGLASAETVLKCHHMFCGYEDLPAETVPCAAAA